MGVKSKPNLTTMLFIILIMFLQLFGLLCFGPISFGFVLLSSPPAAAGLGATRNDALFKPGTGWSYLLENTVLLNSPSGSGKNVGYQIESGVDVSSVWRDPNKDGSRLIRIELKSPKLLIKSRKAPTPEGFVSHSSQLESLSNRPVYILWTSGRIEKFYYTENEDRSLVNYKKGVASLFQFQILDNEIEEADASGHCLVAYSSLSPNSFSKTKTKCTGLEDTYIYNPNKILSNKISSTRQSTYTMNPSNTYIESIATEEFHEMRVVLRQEVGTNVQSIQKLQIDKGKEININPIAASDIQDALQQIENNNGLKLVEDVLVTKRDPNWCPDDNCPNLVKLIKENKEYLKDEYLGSIKSATAFSRVINAVRRANRDDIIKVLRNSKNKKILLQLYDLIGFAQTEDAHRAAMKVLRLESDDDLDYAERYFWASSMGSHPQESVLKDILTQSHKETHNEKLQETILLTVGAMANKFKNNHENHKKLKIVNSVKESLLNGLDFCKNEECELKYLRALKNLNEESTIPTLLQYALNKSTKASVAAMKALRSFPKHAWNSNVFTTCHKIFYQLGKQYDSSSRTLAFDIILESNPSKEVLKNFIHYLRSNDKAYEVKQYVLQRLFMVSEKDPTIKSNVVDLIKSEAKINNYDILGQRGLTTAFSRSFSENPSSNGSLVTIQEIFGGILKRGIVDVVLESEGTSFEMFSLGLFAGGLSSFVSSDDTADLGDGSEEDLPHAGMEVSMLNVQVRPFVFFQGQGDLMGHVWSGSASEKTPAFQIISLLHDHLEYIRLGNGFIAELSLLGAVSFDLSGQIQMSLWNRNAHSLVEKNAGIVLIGLLRVDTTFVRSQVEFNLSMEPKLNLVSDIDFYSGVSLCMQLKQPDTIFKHNIYKIERIPGSKHKLRKATYKTMKVPGRTYALNRKNNEMCNVIFKDEL